MADGLLFELHRRGITLELDDGRVVVRAPTGALTPELRDRLREERDQLAVLLRRTEAGGDLPVIATSPQDRYEPFPLTDIQHAYWVGRSVAVELGGMSTHYYFELDGADLDVDRLERSLNTVIAQHDMLRAVIRPDGRQVVLAEVPEFRIPLLDLRGADPAAQQSERDRWRAEMGGRAPDPDRWPLFEVRASRVDDRAVRLHLSFNILIVDFFSLSLLFRDWRRAYLDPDRRPEPPGLSYRDYVLAQEAARDGARYRQAEEYWLDRLDTLPPAPDLPLAVAPASLDRVEFTRRRARMPRDAWTRLKETARDRGLTPSVALLAAFSEVLRRWSPRQPSFTLNLTLFDRPPVHPQVGEVIGDFTTLTMLAVPDLPDRSFAGRAEAVNAQLMRDLEHLSYSGVRVLRERTRRLGGGLGAAMPVVFTSAIGNASADGGEDDRRFFGALGHGVSQTPQVWLDHQVMEEQGELVYNWDAVEALFPAGLLDDMFGAYRDLLDRLVCDPAAWDTDRPLVPLPPRQAAERAAANATGRSWPDRTLCELVDAQVRARPDAVAVVAGDTRLSYREVDERACRLSRALTGRGARRDALVGIVLDRGWEQVVAALAVTRAGAAYLPVDPQWPPARQRQVLELGGVEVVVADPAAAADLAGFDVVPVDAPGGGPDPVGPAPADLAYVIFTSGSTGTPKGVMIDHRAAANTIVDINSRFGVGPADRVLALSALSFDLSVYDVFGTLAAGGTVVVPTPAGAQDPRHWTALVREHGVTVWNSVPALMQMWVDSLPADAALPGPRLALLSGDWIPVALPDAVRARCPGAEVVSLGGATEASIWSVFFPIGAVPPHWTSIPYGTPLANQTLQVGTGRLEPCPEWTVGEILIGGTGLARGYWADPARTAERFVRHPRSGERLYRTGDLGRYLPGGTIEFLGREDSQVKINGYRIELGEIAATLRRQPGVADAVVRADAHPVTGQRQLVAYVVPAAGAPVGAERLEAALESLLPAYLVPRFYLPIDRVPLSANGKVCPADLPSPWTDGDGPGQVPPRDDLEKALFAIWSETLGRDDFGVTDNFFELGADSLHAVRILGRMRDDLGIEVDGDEGLQTLLESPSVAELADALRDRSAL